MEKSGLKVLWSVFAVVVVLVVLAGVVWVFFGKGGWSGLKSPADQVRPWAEADYDAVMAPVATAIKGSDPRFRPVLKSVERVADETDETKMQLEVVVVDNAEEWSPAYGVHVIDAAGGFEFVDGERSGKVRFVGARTLAREFFEAESGGSGQLERAFFSPAMERLDEAGMKEAGVEGHEVQTWVQTDQPATEIKVGLEVEGYGDVKWQLRGFYDRRTKVNLADGGGWTSEGGKGGFETDLKILHDAEVRLVADFCHGPVERFSLVPGGGEVVEGDDFRVEVVGVVNGYSRRTNSGGSHGEEKSSYRFDDVGGDVTTAIFLIAPKLADDAIKIEAIGKDGKVLRSSGNGSSGFVRKSSWKVKPGEIERFEVVYRPNYERLLIDLPALGGVPEANVGVANLFDCVIPMGEIDGEWELRRAIGDVAQLEVKGASSTRSGGMKEFFPLDLSGMTVGEVVGVYARERPELRFRVDPVALSLEIAEPGAKPWWERAWESVGGWF